MLFIVDSASLPGGDDYVLPADCRDAIDWELEELRRKARD
jgi:hypothetical protein